MVDLVGRQGTAAVSSAGTGVVLTADGQVLTCNHLINGATSITAVDVGDGRTYQAAVVGYDRTHDLALLQLQGAKGLRTLALDPGVFVDLGDPVTVLGNAGGRGGTPSEATGSVTALDQQIVSVDEMNGGSQRLGGLIQVDALLQAGDSGGPLIDASGHVIGISVAAQTPPPGGFAITAAQAQATRVAIAAGRGSSSVHIGATAWLGVATAAGVTLTGRSGALVVQVLPGSPGLRIGLVVGDVIISLGGSPVTGPSSLTGLLDLHHPGDSVSIDWAKETGSARTAPVRLGSGAAG